MPDVVVGDKRYLERVLRHLVTAALESTKEGMVKLDVTHQLGRIRWLNPKP